MSEENDKYYTLTSLSESVFKNKGSKFLGYARPIPNKMAFELFLKEVKALHPKARHFCFAYKIDPLGLSFRANDDGEPSGSAGKPILGQITHFDLSYSAIIVVRYFGGTKLGVAGLIDAYRTASKEAILNNQIIEKFETEKLELKFDYHLMGVLLNIIKDLELQVHNQKFDTNPSITLAIPKSKIGDSIRRIKSRLLNRPLNDIDKDTHVEGISFLEENK